MRLDLMLQSLEDHLRPLVEADGGKLALADSEEAAVQELAKGGPAGRYLATLVPMGGRVDPDNEAAGGIEDRVTILLQAGKGFGYKPSNGLHRATPRGERTPFLQIQAALIRWTRALLVEDEEVDGFRRAFELRSWGWLRDQDRPTRICALEFECLYALDDPDAAVNNITPSGSAAGGVLAWDDAVGLTYTRGGVVYDLQLFPRNGGSPPEDGSSPSALAVAVGGGELDWEEGVGLVYWRGGVAYDFQLFPRAGG